MPETGDGITVTELDSEVWYRIEFSTKGVNDWCVLDTRTFDSMITAKSALDRWLRKIRDEDENDYRLVRVTTLTAVVSYATGAKCTTS